VTDGVVVTGAGAVVAGPPDAVAGLPPGAVAVEPTEDALRRRLTAVRGGRDKSARLMCADVLAAQLAATRALADAGLAPGALAARRPAVLVGTRMSTRMHPGMSDALASTAGEPPARFFAEVLRRVNPLHLLQYLSNRVALHLSISLGAQGPTRTFGGSTCAAAQALLDGFEMVREGAVDVALVGGVDLGFDPVGRALEALAGAGDDGPGAAAFLVLEREAAARARGAVIRGRVLGVACPVGRNCSPQALREVARARALARAGLDPASAAVEAGAAPPPALARGNAHAPLAVLATLDGLAAGRRAVCALADRDLAGAAVVLEAAR